MTTKTTRNINLPPGWRLIRAPFGVELHHAKGVVFSRMNRKHWGIHLTGDRYGSMESYDTAEEAMKKVEAT